MKKLFAFLLAMVMMLALVACNAPQNDTADGDNNGENAVTASFTVEVTHADGAKKTFQYTTTQKNLGDMLEAEGLIESEGADDGMFHTVDGEKADWAVNQSYWAFYVDGEYAMAGIYDTDIVDGTTYGLVYTVG